MGIGSGVACNWRPGWWKTWGLSWGLERGMVWRRLGMVVGIIGRGRVGVLEGVWYDMKLINVGNIVWMEQRTDGWSRRL